VLSLQTETSEVNPMQTTATTVIDKGSVDLEHTVGDSNSPVDRAMTLN